ncbi:hypothetical protein [Fibrella aestuarina]|uniref:hypothetical protein n=1 Tax=Fibrella aestuarina TaxID=651143 RepID=UPI0011D2B885|nr:hypothetical protein [Fibrella aestuarina]
MNSAIKYGYCPGCGQPHADIKLETTLCAPCEVTHSPENRMREYVTYCETYNTYPNRAFYEECKQKLSQPQPQN